MWLGATLSLQYDTPPLSYQMEYQPVLECIEHALIRCFEHAGTTLRLNDWSQLLMYHLQHGSEALDTIELDKNGVFTHRTGVRFRLHTEPSNAPNEMQEEKRECTNTLHKQCSKHRVELLCAVQGVQFAHGDRVFYKARKGLNGTPQLPTRDTMSFGDHEVFAQQGQVQIEWQAYRVLATDLEPLGARRVCCIPFSRLHALHLPLTSAQFPVFRMLQNIIQMCVTQVQQLGTAANQHQAGSHQPCVSNQWAAHLNSQLRQLFEFNRSERWVVLHQRRLHVQLGSRIMRYARQADLIVFQCPEGTSADEVRRIQDEYNRVVPSNETRQSGDNMWESVQDTQHQLIRPVPADAQHIMVIEMKNSEHTFDCVAQTSEYLQQLDAAYGLILAVATRVQEPFVGYTVLKHERSTTSLPFHRFWTREETRVPVGVFYGSELSCPDDWVVPVPLVSREILTSDTFASEGATTSTATAVSMPLPVIRRPPPPFWGTKGVTAQKCFKNRHTPMSVSEISEEIQLSRVMAENEQYFLQEFGGLSLQMTASLFEQCEDARDRQLVAAITVYPKKSGLFTDVKTWAQFLYAIQRWLPDTADQERVLYLTRTACALMGSDPHLQARQALGSGLEDAAVDDTVPAKKRIKRENDE